MCVYDACGMYGRCGRYVVCVYVVCICVVCVHVWDVLWCQWGIWCVCCIVDVGVCVCGMWCGVWDVCMCCGVWCVGCMYACDVEYVVCRMCVCGVVCGICICGVVCVEREKH